MTQVIVGVFDSFDQAENAVAELTKGGVSRADMEVHANDQTAAARDSAAVAGDPTGQADTGEPGMFAKMEHFLGNLFGSESKPEEVGHYQEAVRRGGALLTVNVANEPDVAVVRAAMHGAGAVDIDERVAQWKSTGYNGFDPEAAPYTGDETTADRQAFAVTRESLAVGKREVQAGTVRVYSRVTETPVTETVELRDEHATILRRPVDRLATEADLTEDSVEIHETAEHAVVAKTAHVIEEVVVGREATEHTETIGETLRGTDVEVEHVKTPDAGPNALRPTPPSGAENVDGADIVSPIKSA